MKKQNKTRARLSLAVLFSLLCSAGLRADERHAASGLVLSVDRAHMEIVVSTKEMPGFMDAMVMPFSVVDGKMLDSITRGNLIDFTLVIGKESSHAEDIKIRGY